MDILTGVHPLLVTRITRVLTAMSALGFPMKVVQGLRSTAQQQARYAQGRTLPGKIVTKADGVIHRSNHQASPQDGLGHAVDCAFEGSDPWGEKQSWAVYGACVEVVGLRWGGGSAFRVNGIVDRPHAELL